MQAAVVCGGDALGTVVVDLGAVAVAAGVDLATPVGSVVACSSPWSEPWAATLRQGVSFDPPGVMVRGLGTQEDNLQGRRDGEQKCRELHLEMLTVNVLARVCMFAIE